MANTANSSSTAREAALARRRAMSGKGKAGLAAQAPRAGDGEASAPRAAAPASPGGGQGGGGARAAALARREAMSTQGKAGVANPGRTRTALQAGSASSARPGNKNKSDSGSRPAVAAPTRSAPAPTKSRRAAPPAPPASGARAAALARREAMSGKGKAGLRGGAQGQSQSRATSTSGGGGSARAAALARRQAMSTQGKAGLSSQDRTRQSSPVKSGGAPAIDTVETQAEAENRSGCGCGTRRDNSTPRQQARNTPKSRRPAQQPVNQNTCRVVALARRQATSSRGKAGLNPNGMSPAQTARAANPHLSGRELAQVVRAQRSRNGKAGQKKSEPTGRMRQKPVSGASDAPWKVGTSQTASGQGVTGTMTGRTERTTGNESGLCRSVTGTEYMGAEIFHEFCQTDPSPNPPKVSVVSTGGGNRMSGNEMGRSAKVTGNEPGTCKQVTGTEYLGPEQFATYCGTTPAPGASKITASETRKGKTVTGGGNGERNTRVTGDEYGSFGDTTGTPYSKRGGGEAPPKVGRGHTLRGGDVTGTQVGRSAQVTGDEPGSCRAITGDEYIGQEQYSGFCTKTPPPEDAKVGVSHTFHGGRVSGTQTGRSSRVTGDEPGTCKAITGTPYAGSEQYYSYCRPEDSQLAAIRTPKVAGMGAGAVMTGQQPGMGGKLTGTEKGACGPVSGTPYLGADQYADVCPATPAEPDSPDFPQPLDAMPWGQFSVEPPLHAGRQEPQMTGGVTGTHYENNHITGPFGKAGGKVTGTEEARFGRRGPLETADYIPPTTETAEDGRLKSRVTGEGMDTGSRITGDDWERGDRVTGTEGTSSMGRNPTRRGPPMSAMTPPPKRNEETPEPVSRVTGGSGNTDRGAVVTYSGGARG